MRFSFMKQSASLDVKRMDFTDTKKVLNESARNYNG